MFTGIIEHMGVVIERTEAPHGVRLALDPSGWDHRPCEGDSISIDGCCLTVAAPPDEDRLEFDAVPQTLRLTTIGDLRGGDQVNLEHAATPTTLLGGHIVQGHVDGVGVVESVHEGEDWRVRIVPPAELMVFIADQGSITVQGVSLTVAVRGESWFEVALIPTTLEKTTLDGLSAGARVNLEVDCIAKMVVGWLETVGQRSLTPDP